MPQSSRKIPVDMSHVLTALGKNLDVLDKIIDYLRHNSTQQLDQLHIAIEHQDHVVVQKTAHALKGALANFNVQKATHLASLLEEAGKAGNLTDAPGLLEELRQEVEEILIYFEGDNWKKDWL